MRKKLLSIFVALICFFCSVLLAEAHPQQSVECIDEEYSFSDFYEKFVSLPHFQEKRVSIPLIFFRYDENSSSYTIETINEWQYIDLAMFPYNGKVKKTLISSTVYIISYEIIDTAICYKLIFRKINGKWMLTDYIDESM